MNRREALATLGAAGLALGDAGRAAAEGKDDVLFPDLTIREAMRAEEHVKEKKVVTEGEGTYLASAVFRRETDPPYWEVTWRRGERVIAGGWFAVHLRSAQDVDVFYGE